MPVDDYPVNTEYIRWDYSEEQERQIIRINKLVDSNPSKEQLVAHLNTRPNDLEALLGRETLGLTEEYLITLFCGVPETRETPSDDIIFLSRMSSTINYLVSTGNYTRLINFLIHKFGGQYQLARVLVLNKDLTSEQLLQVFVRFAENNPPVDPKKTIVFDEYKTQRENVSYALLHHQNITPEIVKEVWERGYGSVTILYHPLVPLNIIFDALFNMNIMFPDDDSFTEKDWDNVFNAAICRPDWDENIRGFLTEQQGINVSELPIEWCNDFVRNTYKPF